MFLDHDEVLSCNTPLLIGMKKKKPPEGVKEGMWTWGLSELEGFCSFRRDFTVL